MSQSIINSKLVYVEEFTKQNIIFLCDLFNAEDGFKTRSVRMSHNLDDKSYFELRQILNSTPKAWKKVVKESQSDSPILVLLDHQLFKIYFCNLEEETKNHLFYYCTCIKDIWNQIQPYFNDSLRFSQLIPRTAIYRFHNIDNDTFLIQNHIPLLLKLHI